ncbi:hypothetical protein J6590_102672 [Homalodisca vitripennis]|nr:hypothetical protein J6590_102672 [Homalodisca vitripennis]
MGRWEEAERKFSSFIPPLSPPTATSSFRFHIISSLFKPCCNSLLWRIFSGIHTLLQPLCYIPVQVNLHKKDAACEEQTAPPVLKGCRMRPCDMGSPKDASMRHLEPIVGKTMCELIQALTAKMAARRKSRISLKKRLKRARGRLCSDAVEVNKSNTWVSGWGADPNVQRLAAMRMYLNHFEREIRASTKHCQEEDAAEHTLLFCEKWVEERTSAGSEDMGMLDACFIIRRKMEDDPD